MSRVALLGASGLVGGLIVHELRSRDLEVVAVGRDAGRTRARLADLPFTSASELAGVEVRELGGDRPEALADAIAGCSLVIDAVGDDEWAPLVLETALRAEVHLLDVSPAQHRASAVHAAHERCVAAGVSVVPGAGFQHLVGDTLAHLAGTATRGARDVHVAYTLPDRGSPLGAASPGRRRSAATSLLAPAVAYVEGALVPDPVGEQRRLAWFPRPVGPAHAAAVPGGEVVSVPLHLPDVQTVRTYLALSGWRSEWLQFVGTMASWDWMRGRLAQRIGRPRRGAPGAGRMRIRWGCVAEANGDDGVARAWAYGHDPYRLTAVAAVAAGGVLLRNATLPGVLPPADLAPPGDLLDLLAVRTDLRWSVTRPDGPSDWPAR